MRFEESKLIFVLKKVFVISLVKFIALVSPIWTKSSLFDWLCLILRGVFKSDKIKFGLGRALVLIDETFIFSSYKFY